MSVFCLSLSISVHGIAQFSLDSFSRNFICDIFVEIYQNNWFWLKLDRNNRPFTWRLVFIVVTDCFLCDIWFEAKNSFHNWDRLCSLWGKAEPEETVEQQTWFDCKLRDIGIRETLVLSYQFSDISLMADCRSVTKIWRNFIVWVKILGDFLENFHRLSLGDNNWANFPEVLCSVDIC
jgi:hypothetical protein